MDDKKPFKVARQYRTHELSKTDGGVTVVVERKDGKSREYTDVKKPDAFIATVYRKDSEGAVKAVYVKSDKKFCIVVAVKDRAYATLDSPWSDHDLMKAGFKVIERYDTQAERDNAFAELKEKQKSKKGGAE
jgi:hypothetical protein